MKSARLQTSIWHFDLPIQNPVRVDLGLLGNIGSEILDHGDAVVRNLKNGLIARQKPAIIDGGFELFEVPLVLLRV